LGKELTVSRITDKGGTPDWSAPAWLRKRKIGTVAVGCCGLYSGKVKGEAFRFAIEFVLDAEVTAICDNPHAIRSRYSPPLAHRSG
jgi:hypothetical protein